jgi:hypothetical protein
MRVLSSSRERERVLTRATLHADLVPECMVTGRSGAHLSSGAAGIDAEPDDDLRQEARHIVGTSLSR